jgi:hypothetical protein
MGAPTVNVTEGAGKVLFSMADAGTNSSSAPTVGLPPDQVTTLSALPSGAATAAKQPALGTAGSPSSDVLTVQGIASGTALAVTVAGVATASKQPALGTAGSPSADVLTVQGSASGTSIPVAITSGGGLSQTITNPTSTLTRPANTTAYVANAIIANNTSGASVVVPSFAIQNSAGGASIPRLRLSTNVTTGWGGVSININLWTAAPTFTNGDNGSYAPATGAAAYLGQFSVSLNQFSDGASGIAVSSSGNPVNVRLASGTAIYWDMQITGTATPISGQTFTLIPEVLN